MEEGLEEEGEAVVFGRSPVLLSELPELEEASGDVFENDEGVSVEEVEEVEEVVEGEF